MRLRLALPRHKILLCLSVSDNLQILGAGLIAFIGLRLQPIVTSQSCQVLRQIIEVIGMQTHTTSSGFIVLLAIERYIACIYSLRFHVIITQSKTNLAVASVWVISILCGLLGLHPNEPNYSPLPISNTLRSQWIYIITTAVPTVVLTIVQARLYRLSSTKLKVVPHNMFGSQKEKVDLARRHLKLGISASIVIIMYVVCMLPMACLSVYILINPEKDVFKIKQNVTSLALLNTFIDPFVYGFGMSDMRQGIKRQFKSLKDCVCRK